MFVEWLDLLNVLFVCIYNIIVLVVLHVCWYRKTVCKLKNKFVFMYCYCMFVICQEISVHSAYITWYLNGVMVNVSDSYSYNLA